MEATGSSVEFRSVETVEWSSEEFRYVHLISVRLSSVEVSSVEFFCRTEYCITVGSVKFSTVELSFVKSNSVEFRSVQYTIFCWIEVVFRSLELSSTELLVSSLKILLLWKCRNFLK